MRIFVSGAAGCAASGGAVTAGDVQGDDRCEGVGWEEVEARACAAPGWFTELMPNGEEDMDMSQPSSPCASAHVAVCPLTPHLIQGLKIVGCPSAGTSLFSMYLRLVALLVHIHIHIHTRIHTPSVLCPC